MNKPAWTSLLLVLSLGCSFALACGMPFAALAAVAVLNLSPRDAGVAVGLGWLANQAIGFGLLGYPVDALTLAWGVALGLSALAAVVAAVFGLRIVKVDHVALKAASCFLVAWLAQQASVFLASLVLGGTATAFALSVVWFIFWTNAAAFCALCGLALLAGKWGVAPQTVRQFAG